MHHGRTIPLPTETPEQNKMTENNNGLVRGALTAGFVLKERFEIVRLLGRGSFAETYLAYDHQTERKVAVKAFHPEKVDSWKSYDLFKREVKTLQSLKHPGIPTIYDYCEEKSPFQVSCIIMEYIEGESLQDMIARRQSMDPIELIGLFVKMLDILEYLHSRIPPVLHRDIKPANIIIRPDGSPVLIDFGSVRTIFKAPDERGSTIIGTFGYMPYEQYMGQASPASDIYSLAATFLEIVSGRSPSEFINSESEIVIPDTLVMPSHLRELFHCMLLSSVGQRIQSVKEVKNRLLAPIIKADTSPLPGAPVNDSRSPVTIRQLPAEKIATMLLEAQQQYMPRVTQLMMVNAQGEFPDHLGRGHLGLIFGFGALSLGLWPLGTWLYQRGLCRKFKTFFERGVQTLGVIDTIIFIPGSQASTYPRYKVVYHFEADGQVHKNALQLRPPLAQFWKENMAVVVLYLPDQKYQSIIIGEA